MIVNSSVKFIEVRYNILLCYLAFQFFRFPQQYQKSHNAHWTQIAVILTSAYEVIVWKHVTSMCVE